VGGDHDRYITGPSARKVDDLVKALGESGISNSTVSRICTQIEPDVAVLRTRWLDHQPFVYVWLDATYVHVREHRQLDSPSIECFPIERRVGAISAGRADALDRDLRRAPGGHASGVLGARGGSANPINPAFEFAPAWDVRAWFSDTGEEADRTFAAPSALIARERYDERRMLGTGLIRHHPFGEHASGYGLHEASGQLERRPT
jgi:hypothetical protein